jgi:hypothetical protein
MHNLRCFGFIHKPSYMQQLDERLENFRRESALLHVVCALGAKYVIAAPAMRRPWC